MVPGESGGEGGDSCAAMCSLKCLQSCRTPAVAQVASVRRVRCPSCSEQSCRAGPRAVRCCGDHSRFRVVPGWQCQAHGRAGAGRPGRACVVAPVVSGPRAV